jgi:hypothetical protein
MGKPKLTTQNNGVIATKFNNQWNWSFKEAHHDQTIVKLKDALRLLFNTKLTCNKKTSNSKSSRWGIIFQVPYS